MYGELSFLLLFLSALPVYLLTQTAVAFSIVLLIAKPGAGASLVIPGAG